ncbi:hypothetical protein [Limnohabitans sp.]|uniref:hypothetical protein n=1 Tax=Limnohabitans sp. TaxID=1907725 RepID=UPI00286F544A|nr:hypothetical protein [Limnohabitans sp.]
MTQQTQQSNTLFVIAVLAAGWYIVTRPRVQYANIGGVNQPYVGSYLQGPYAAQQMAQQQQVAQASMWTNAGSAIGSLINKFWGNGPAPQPQVQNSMMQDVNTVRTASGIFYPQQPDDSAGWGYDANPTQYAPGYQDAW